MMNSLLRVLAAAALIACSTVSADEVALNPDHPERYTVVEGDTLWDISARFLKDPWLWPKVWKRNAQIKNPHLIYPGDVVVLAIDENGAPEIKVLRSERRTVKLSPTIYTSPIDGAIPTIPPNAILPYLSRPLVIEDGTLKSAGYVAVGLDDKLVLGKHSEFYARALARSDSGSYEVFRPGEALIDPDTKEPLGQEAIYLGRARMVTPGDPAKLLVTESKREIIPGDRMLPSPDDVPLPYYQPHAPDATVRGRILTVLDGVQEFGPGAVVAISLGERNGVEHGHVLRIKRSAGTRRDPVTGKDYELPEEAAGLLMVFRTFDKVSYGLVMTASRPINVLDVVQTP
jgi:LysM repeat protein